MDTSNEPNESSILHYEVAKGAKIQVPYRYTGGLFPTKTTKAAAYAAVAKAIRSGDSSLPSAMQSAKATMNAIVTISLTNWPFTKVMIKTAR